VITRDRLRVLQQIGALLDGKCTGCSKREELGRQYGKVFSRIDGYCNRECAVGRKLQELGKELRR